MAGVKELYEFLEEAELGQYYSAFQNQLKVTTVPQLKYVEDSDMSELGMTRPEMRRLKKFFRKECPQGALGKIKKILTKPGLEAPHQGSPPNDRSPAHVKGASKHIIPQDAITVCTTLGTGEFGTVQQGIWTNEDGDRVQVAIKCLSKEKMQTGIADFLKEATIMHSLDHAHIVQLYGVVLDSQSYMLVTELAPLRSLLECLKEARLRSSFTVHVLCEFAIQIVEGMAYLEAKRLIHRDLAARNVLVFAKDKVKISDFGLSRALGVGKDYYQTNFNVNLKLPIAWCAPECIHYLKFTSASDVWAFGVTLWEMFSYGFQPWAAFTGQQILDAIDEPNCQRLDCPDACPKQYYDLMLKCWDIDDKKRPTFSEISRILPQIKPEQVQAMEDSGNQNNEFLVYNKQDLITVLDKRPNDPPAPGLWKGVTDNGKTGWFLSVNVAPYIELKAASSPMLRKVKINRKESGRKSMKGGKKLHAGLISRPQNDLRHTGHIGYDGAMFGDVAFIGDNYDKLPVKVVTPYKPHEDLESSMTSSIPPPDDADKPDGFSSSMASLTSESANPMSTSIISDTSYTSMASSQDTLTDVSSFHGDTDSLVPVKNGRVSPAKYEDVEETDLDNFRLPDISSSLSLDFGPSFMDEVMKALNDSGDSKKSVEDVSADSALLTDTSPLLERDMAPPRFSSPHSAAAFDNVAMAPASDIDSNESHSRTISSTDLDHQTGDLDSSFSSAKDTPDSRKSEDLDEEDSQKFLKPKLKLDDKLECDSMIPVHSKKPETKKQAKVKPMSAADEKKIDEAIAMANEFALYSRADRSPSPALLEDPDSSPSLLNMLGIKKKEKSPKPKKKKVPTATLR